MPLPALLHPDPARSDADAALASRVAKGDARALETMMRVHNRALFRAARSILRDDAEAEDAVQEAYISAYKAIGSFRGEARLATWLTRIAINKALEHARRRPRGDEPAEGSEMSDETNEHDAGIPGPETLAMRGELRRFLERNVDRLPAGYRSVFVLRAVEGFSVEETALTLSVSEAVVKVRYMRARRMLREAMGREIEPLASELFAFDGARCDRLVARVAARLGLMPFAVSPPPDTGLG